VEASSEPLSFDDFCRREHRHVFGAIAAYDSPGAWVRRVTGNRAASVLRRGVREAKTLVPLARRHLDDYSMREISAVLDCSEGTVKTHLSRARDAVARHLRLEDPQ
jgi:DNA-directed RNA polymerase specialized sigma24 family protein